MKFNLNCSKWELLEYINEVSLACLDLCLYLDTHPKDEKAHELFHEYLEMRKEGLMAFSHKYGPLTLDSAACPDTTIWQWVMQPWPWEPEYCNRCNCVSSRK